MRKLNNEWWGFSQMSHAWVTGQLASAWGNQHFLVPEPRRELLLAAALHDLGWIEWEQHPEINEETGLPYNFVAMPLLKHIEIWKNGTSKAVVINRFVAWLISCHNSYLLRFRDLDREPGNTRCAAVTFLEEQEALQEQLILSMRSDKRYEPYMTDKSMHKYKQLLRAWDYFSLVLCMGDMDEDEISEARNEEDQSSVIVRKNQSDFRYEVHPWPFTGRSLTVGCEAVRLEKQQNSESNPINPDRMKTFEWELIPG